MMITSWFYADRQQQQQGPVDTAWLQGAFARGDVLATTLVWREGMAGWKPLAQVASELGIAMASTPPLPPVVGAAPRKAVVVAPSGGSPLLLILVIVGVVVLFFGGILAAIAIPAYQDYTQRAKVSQALNAATPIKLAVEEFVIANERCPANEEGGIGTPESYADGVLQAAHAGALDDSSGRCAIELQLSGVAGEGDDEAHTLTMIRRDASDWVYSTTLQPRYLPASMRDRLEAE